MSHRPAEYRTFRLHEFDASSCLIVKHKLREHSIEVISVERIKECDTIGERDYRQVTVLVKELEEEPK